MQCKPYKAKRVPCYASPHALRLLKLSPPHVWIFIVKYEQVGVV